MYLDLPDDCLRVDEMRTALYSFALIMERTAKQPETALARISATLFLGDAARSASRGLTGSGLDLDG